MSRPSSRDRLLRAASTIVMRNGADRLTLDAVAHEAALSKGGVLYHFPTKEALLEAMLERWVEEFEASIEAALTDAPSGRGAWLRAFVKASAEETWTAGTSAPALLAAIAHHPDLLARIRERTAVWQHRLVEDFDPALATLLRLASDGLFWAEMLDLAPPTGALRTEVVETMLRLVEQDR